MVLNTYNLQQNGVLDTITVCRFGGGEFDTRRVKDVGEIAGYAGVVNK